MNLFQSICCFFSSRCASGAEPKKADRDGSGETPDVGTAPRPRRPATPDTEVASGGGAGVERALRPRDLVVAVVERALRSAGDSSPVES